MSTEREELAQVIDATDMLGCGCCAASTVVQVGPEEWETEFRDRQEVLADAILAAGYRKPRTVTTAEELDALPEGSIVLDIGGEPWQKEGSVFLGQLGGALTSKRLAHAALPATVLHVGGEQ